VCGLCAQVQQEAGLLIGVDSDGAVVAEDETMPAAPVETTPTRRPRGRPRKYPKQVSDVCVWFWWHVILLFFLSSVL